MALAVWKHSDGQPLHTANQFNENCANNDRCTNNTLHLLCQLAALIPVCISFHILIRQYLLLLQDDNQTVLTGVVLLRAAYIS